MTRAVCILGLSLGLAAAQPRNTLNLTAKQAVSSVSEVRIGQILRRFEAFGTRNTFSSTDHPTRGIGAARRWIREQFESYSPRLQVRLDSHRVKAQYRIPRDVEIVNVVAVLPGRTDRQVLVVAHYDSLNLDGEDKEAPGISDNASGTAAVMEMARVLSQYEFEKTLVFIAFAGEEQFMVGSTLYAAAAKAHGDTIDAVLNSDLIGTEIAGNGHSLPNVLRVFSADPPDSPSRHLARYFKTIGERYVPSMKVQVVFREDRFGRGGDHTAFELEGFPAVRLTTPNENYSQQHNLADNVEHASIPYITRVTRLKTAVAASLGLAPPAPDVSLVTRGTSSPYDAVIRWYPTGASEHPASYSVMMRQTTAPYWEKEIPAGDVRELCLPNTSIDDVVFGVKAYGRNGVESPVATYAPRPSQKQTIEVER